MENVAIVMSWVVVLGFIFFMVISRIIDSKETK